MSRMHAYMSTLRISHESEESHIDSNKWKSYCREVEQENPLLATYLVGRIACTYKATSGLVAAAERVTIQTAQRVRPFTRQTRPTTPVAQQTGQITANKQLQPSATLIGPDWYEAGQANYRKQKCVT